MRTKTKEQIDQQGQRLLEAALDTIRHGLTVLGGTYNEQTAAERITKAWNASLRVNGYIIPKR